MDGGRTTAGVSPLKVEKRIKAKRFVVRIGSVTVKAYPTPPGWTVSWVSVDGRQRKYVPSENKARELAADMAKQLSEGITKVISTEEIATLQRARELLRPFGVSIELAVAEWVDAKKRIGLLSLGEVVNFWASRRAVVCVPVMDAVEEFLAEKEKDKKFDQIGDRHHNDLKARLGHFSKAFGGTRMDSLTPAAVEEWLAGLKKLDKKPVSPQSRNNFRAAVINFLHFAGGSQRRWLGVPMEDFEEQVRVMEVRNGRVEIYTPEEAVALFRGCPQELIGALVLGGWSGLRSSEIERVLWRGVDLDSKAVYDFAGKVRTAGDRVAHLPDCAIEWLRPLKEAAGPVCPFTNLGNHWDRIKGVRWIQNGLRHSYVSYRLAITGDLAKVSEETGTDVKTLRRKYRRPVLRQAAEKWFAMTPRSVSTASEGFVVPGWWTELWGVENPQIR